jgi:hypothetical protein
MIVELASGLITIKKRERKLKALYFEKSLQAHCPGAQAQLLSSPLHEHFVFPPPTFIKSAFGHEERIAPLHTDNCQCSLHSCKSSCQCPVHSTRRSWRS